MGQTLQAVFKFADWRTDGQTVLQTGLKWYDHHSTHPLSSDRGIENGNSHLQQYYVSSYTIALNLHYYTYICCRFGRGATMQPAREKSSWKLLSVARLFTDLIMFQSVATLVTMCGLVFLREVLGWVWKLREHYVSVPIQSHLSEGLKYRPPVLVKPSKMSFNCFKTDWIKHNLWPSYGNLEI